MDAIQDKIEQDPTLPMKKKANQLNVNPNTQTAVNTDLGLKSFARTPRQLLTEALKSKRLTCKKVLHYLKTHVTIYSDEKMFTVNAVVNRRNDR